MVIENNFEEFKNRRKIAMLIDGDNAQPSLMEKMLAEASKHGLVTIRQIYGDWTTPNMSGWKDELHTYAFQPIQQFRNTVGKNATDSAMIIDAMDILRDDLVEGFCIVSSDSDYTRLATRIRKSGIFVMGIGRKQTPKSFVNACYVFTYTENLTEDLTHNNTTKTKDKTKKKQETEVHIVNDEEPIPLLKQAYEMAALEDGWAVLAAVGGYLRQLDPSFDPRTYKYKQLSQLINAYPDIFEVKNIKDANGVTILIRMIPQK